MIINNLQTNTILQCLWSSCGQVGMQTQCWGVEMEEKQTFNMPAGPLCLWQQRPGLTRSFRCAPSCLDVVGFVPWDSLSPSFSANICYSGVVLYNFHGQEGRSRTPSHLNKEYLWGHLNNQDLFWLNITWRIEWVRVSRCRRDGLFLGLFGRHTLVPAPS